MGKIKSLNTYQKGILIFMIIISLIFAVVYPKIISKVGFNYNGTIFLESEENGNIIYSGKIKGKEAHFVISDDKTVKFYYGDKLYGPYTAKEDSAAIPKGEEFFNSMTGVELREGETVIFRGGVFDTGDLYLLYNEDGTAANIGISFTTGDGIVRDENGNPIDLVKPTATDILRLINKPELTHKGTGYAWFVAVLICIINTITILFADELFRWNLSFRVKYVYDVEPSDWEVAGRYIGWTLMAIMAFVIFVIGLR